MKAFNKVKQHIKAIGPMPFIYAAAMIITIPVTALGADGTQTIIKGLDGLSTKLVTIGTPLSALGFTGAAVVHSVSHDMQTQEKAKSGMKAAGVGVAATLLGSAIVGMVASAFGG